MFVIILQSRQGGGNDNLWSSRAIESERRNVSNLLVVSMQVLICVHLDWRLVLVCCTYLFSNSWLTGTAVCAFQFCFIWVYIVLLPIGIVYDNNCTIHWVKQNPGCCIIPPSRTINHPPPLPLDQGLIMYHVSKSCLDPIIALRMSHDCWINVWQQVFRWSFLLFCSWC